MTVIDLLFASVKRYPNAPAVTIKRGYRTLTLTYTQLYDLARSVAGLLQKHGIRPGENVVLLAPNSPYWVAVYFGTIMNGCRIVPLTIQSQADFVEKALAQTDARIFFKHKLFTAAVGRTVITVDVDFLDDLVANIDPAHIDVPALHADDVMEILYTSGTTGDPKGAMLTHANLVSNVCSLDVAIAVNQRKDRVLSILPLSHILEQTIGMLLPIYKGVHIIYAHSPALIASLMYQHRITKMIAVPEFLQIIRSRVQETAQRKHVEKLFNGLMYGAQWLNWRWFSRLLFKLALHQLGGKLDTLASGGAPLNIELERWWNALGVIILQGYGLTETSPVVTLNTYHEHRFGSVGKVVRDVQVRIAQDGEILVKGPNVFTGYYKNEQKTRESFDEQGFFKTGDIGEFDADGFLFLRGRKKYMILGPGGQNVYPEDIEEVLNKINGVKDSAVLGIELPNGAVAIHAVLLLEAGAQVPKDIIEQANQRLASYQHITDWTVWPDIDFPRSATLKVKKEAVKQYLQGKIERSVHATALVSPLIRLLSTLSGVPLNSIGQSSLLVRDLHLDSLKRVELIARIEQVFHVQIDETALTAQLTVGMLQELIDKKEPIKPLPTLKYWPRTYLAAVVRFVLQNIFFLISRLFLRIEVHGLNNIENMRGVALFMPNHLSNWDSAVVARVMPWRVRWRLSFAAAQDVVYDTYWYVAWLVELAFNCFSLPRQKNSHIKIGLENTGQMLDWGYHVVIFPEGKMSKDGQLLPLKEGAGLMATQMGVPVVPIRIRGIERIFPYDTFLPRSRGTVQVTIGAPLVFSRDTSYQEATQQLYSALTRL
jgi:long-chain acyl-CoA synthetase